ncbi:phosphate/phosphite/phosphonate ABC transporter substrate-binding protein [Nisaea acidiphila]|uniref:Phosphate/phosphite/phosphonate ABC transporter substrate-binding protein n=1 Tax=Nisaea acidiphila TaxID=1862145 RepID=A0A9J7ATW1_9PROT|nr:phosphate/phosphite/phosphonate ABC transporter substrate-binding protein [Nisaea acidiphila]UUX50759.1 phosphate/phosphite/phosphonate ABC transporter substrate-binding protein [Nisaea acidiphila]
MIATLDMYDLPEIREATDAWWQALARGFEAEGLTGVPQTRTRLAEESDAWSRPDLFFTQICGYPLRRFHKDGLTVLGAPCYEAEGCNGPRYRSAVIVQSGAGITSIEGLRGQRLAYNNSSSQSGMSALRALLAEQGAGPGFFGDAIRSGGHRMSVALVTSGEADVAAVDCVTWALLRKYAPEECAAVEILAWTPDAPGLPYAVRAGAAPASIAAMRRGIERALADPSAKEARAALLIDGFTPLADHNYVEIDEIETFAVERGLPSLF